MAVSSEMKVVFAAKCILLDWNAAAALQNDNLMGCFLSQKKYLYIFCLMSYILHFLCLRPVFNSRSILSFDILLLDMIHGHYRPTPRYMIQYPPLRHITDGYTAYQAEDLMDTCPEYHHGMARLYCVWGFYWVVFLFTEQKTATRQFSGVFSCDSRKPKVFPRVSILFEFAE